MPKWIWDLMLTLLVKASPELKAMLCGKLDELEAKAKETRNPFDDILVKMAKGMVGCKDK